MESVWSDFSLALKHLWEVPSGLLSTQGIAQGAGFAALAYARQMINPPVRDALRAMPLAQVSEPIWNGMWTNANFIYGMSNHR